jgi:tRNA uridine 5-carboxymethylaminomethyl modification enzyme
VLLRPEVTIGDLVKYNLLRVDEIMRESFYKRELIQSVEIELKYRGYIIREKLLAEKTRRLEGIKIDTEIDYNTLLSISTEGRQKLSYHMPATIGQASRISGISPSDIHVLLLYMGR